MKTIEGVSFVLRKLAGTAKPTVILEDKGDGSWTITRKGGPKEVTLNKFECYIPQK